MEGIIKFIMERIPQPDFLLSPAGCILREVLVEEDFHNGAGFAVPIQRASLMNHEDAVTGTLLISFIPEAVFLGL